MNIPLSLTVLILAFGLPLNVFVTWKLWRLSRANPHLRVLRERLIVAVGVLLVIVALLAVFVNNDLIPPLVAFEHTKIVTRSVVLVLAVIPAAYWLRLYRYD